MLCPVCRPVQGRATGPGRPPRSKQEARSLIVEVHPNPDAAKCDGAQSLTFENFSTLMGQVTSIRDSLMSEVTA